MAVAVREKAVIIVGLQMVMGGLSPAENEYLSPDAGLGICVYMLRFKHDTHTL